MHDGPPRFPFFQPWQERADMIDDDRLINQWGNLARCCEGLPDREAVSVTARQAIATSDLLLRLLAENRRLREGRP